MKSAALPLDRAEESLLDVVRAGDDDRVRPLCERVTEEEVPVLVEVLDDDVASLGGALVSSSFPQK